MADDKNLKPKKDNASFGIGVGIALGAAIGAAFDNIGLGVALGVCFGAAYDVTQAKKTKEKNKDDEDSNP